MIASFFNDVPVIRLLLAAACVLAGGVSAAHGQAQAQEQDPVALYDALRTRYRKITTFRAQLSCELKLLGAASERVTGSIAMERGAKWYVRLEAEPQGQSSARLVLFDLCNGMSRWTFDSKSKSLIKQEGSGRESSGPGNFFPAFELYDAASVKLVGQRAQRVQLKVTSKGEAALFAAVVLSVNQQLNLVEQMEFQDWKGDTSMRVLFEDAHLNEPLDASVFSVETLPHFPVRRFVSESSSKK